MTAGPGSRAAWAVVLWCLTAGPARGAGLAGVWESTDPGFRAIVHGPPHAPRVILYGTVTAGGVPRRFVASSVRTQRVAGGLRLQLPPRRLFAGGAGPAALAGHRSELPPAAAESAGTTWLLRRAGDALVLACDPPASAACGLPAPVRLLARGVAPAAP